MQQLPRTNLPGNERGATLVVSLILLILISLLGANSMRNATVAEKMSSADHQKNITFRASESAANQSLSTTDIISEAIIAGTPIFKNIDSNSPDTTVANTTTDVTYMHVGSGPVLNASIGANGFTGERIMVTSTASLTSDTRSTAETVHGVVLMVPSPQ